MVSVKGWTLCGPWVGLLLLLDIVEVMVGGLGLLWFLVVSPGGLALGGGSLPSSADFTTDST